MDNTGWLFGLEKFFEFKNLHEHKAFIRAFINLLYAEGKDKPWALKTCICMDYESFPAMDRDQRINLYTDVLTRQRFSQRTLFWLFHNIWGDDFTNKLYLFFNNTDAEVANDLFSKSQVQSKIWMAETLNKFQQKFGNILLLGGWYGQHHWYLDKFKYDTLYNVDLDSDVLEKSKHILAAADRYATAAADVLDVITDSGKIIFNNQSIEADLVINTSSEHMSTVWFDRLPMGQTVLLQSNDMLDMEGHVNCVKSLEELKQRYTMRQILFSGELLLSKGNRFMMYGIK
jgi:hypothetical protein